MHPQMVCVGGTGIIVLQVVDPKKAFSENYRTARVLLSKLGLFLTQIMRQLKICDTYKYSRQNLTKVAGYQ